MQRLAFAFLVLLPACQKSASTSEPPPPQNGDARPELTAAACVAQGGNVVGDIGDGAVLRPDYICESNAQPPLGVIVAEEGGPIGVEGSVCCGL